MSCWVEVLLVMEGAEVKEAVVVALVEVLLASVVFAESVTDWVVVAVSVLLLVSVTFVTA